MILFQKMRKLTRYLLSLPELSCMQPSLYIIDLPCVQDQAKDVEEQRRQHQVPSWTLTLITMDSMRTL